MTRQRNRQQGNALATVLIVGVLVTLTAAITLNVTGFRWRSSQMDVQRLQAFAAAEAGLNDAFARLNLGVPLPCPSCGVPWRTDGTDTRSYDLAEPVNGKRVKVTITHRNTADSAKPEYDPTGRPFKITAATRDAP